MSIITQPRSLAAALCAVLAGCNSGDLVSGTRRAPEKTLWSVETNAVALTMALGDTFHLAVTPYTFNGDTIGGLIRSFRSGDNKKVPIDANGVIVAKGLTDAFNPVPIYATVTSPFDSLTVEDTVLVVVNGAREEIASFSIQPLPDDSTIQAAGIPGRSVDARAFDESGLPITDLNVVYRTSNRRVAIFGGPGGPTWSSSSYFGGVDTGTVMLYAQTTAYGTVYEDSVQFRITFPITGYFNIYPRIFSIPETDPVLSGPTLKIAVGGIVTWNSQSPTDVDIVFDDPSKATDPDGPDGPEVGGNIPHIKGYEISASRQFLVAGTYTFHSTRYPGIQGAVEVVP